MKHSSTETRAVSAGATLKPRGSSQGGLRQYNERAVLQALRLHGPLPAAELARLTHLTAQTISLISKRLLDDGLIVKGELLRGKVGQPSVPLGICGRPTGCRGLSPTSAWTTGSALSPSKARRIRRMSLSTGRRVPTT